MYDENDLTVLDEPASPLDQLEPLQANPEAVNVEATLNLLSSSDSQQRIVAARAFCEIQDDRVVPHLIKILNDPCPLVRVSVAYALGRNTSPDAVEPLIQQLQMDLNGYVRKGIVWALGNSRDRRALPSLIQALKYDVPAVRLWAASALAQISNLGYEAAVSTIPVLIEGLRRDSVPAVRSNCAWTLGKMARELPSNVIYATAIDALIEAFAEDEEVGVREDARSALLGVGDPRGLQVIDELEQEGWF